VFSEQRQDGGASLQFDSVEIITLRRDTSECTFGRKFLNVALKRFCFAGQARAFGLDFLFLSSYSGWHLLTPAVSRVDGLRAAIIA
jgi:hypothetical protein